MASVRQAWSIGVTSKQIVRPFRYNISAESSSRKKIRLEGTKGQRETVGGLWNSKLPVRKNLQKHCPAATICANQSSRLPTQGFGFEQIGEVEDGQDHMQLKNGGCCTDAPGVIKFRFSKFAQSKSSEEAMIGGPEGSSKNQPNVDERLPSNADSNERRSGRQDRFRSPLQPKPSPREKNPRDSRLEKHGGSAVRSGTNDEFLKTTNSHLVIKSNSLNPHIPFVPTKTSEKNVSNQRVDKRDATMDVVRKAVIDVLAHSDDMGDALQRATKSLGNRSSYWDQMMKELERRGARRQALQVFRFLQAQSKFELREQNYVTIISILGREGKLGLVMELFDGMKDVGITPSVHSFTALISGYTKQGLLKEAWEVFEVMKEGCNPNVVTYNTLIHASAKSGFRLNKVVGLFEEMKKASIQPDDITYNCLINSCVRQNRFDMASQILKEMKSVNCLPNVVSYTAMINSYGKSGKLEEAVKLFEEMKELGRAPNSWTFNSLLKAYASEGCYDKAMCLYEEMENSGCAPDLYTYNTVIHMCGRGGLFEEAEGVFIEMQRKGCAPDRVTYNTMLDAYSKGGHTKQARTVLEKMRSAGCPPDLWTYNILLDASGKAGSVVEATEIFQDLKNAGHSPNLVSYSSLISTYGRCGLFEGAQSVWREMRAGGCVPNATAYCGLINSFSHHGMHQEALSTFEEMQKNGVEPDTQSYTALMDAYGQAGLCNEAERVLKQMKSAGFIADCVTYGVLVRAFAKAERFHEGLEYFEYILKNLEQDHVESQKLIAQHSAAYAQYTKFLNQ